MTYERKAQFRSVQLFVGVRRILPAPQNLQLLGHFDELRHLHTMLAFRIKLHTAYMHTFLCCSRPTSTVNVASNELYTPRLVARSATAHTQNYRLPCCAVRGDRLAASAHVPLHRQSVISTCRMCCRDNHIPGIFLRFAQRNVDSPHSSRTVGRP